MKTTFLSLVLTAFVSLAGVPAAQAQFGLPSPGGSNLPRAKFAEDTLKLSALFPVMSVYEGLPDFDGVNRDVRYKSVGNAKYDDIFKDAGSINGRVKETKFLTAKYGTKPADFATNSAKAAKDKAVAAMDFKALLGKLTASLTSDNGRIAGLLGQLGNLRPQDDFSPLDAPNVADAIKKAKENLESAATETPKLLSEIEKISKGGK